MSDISELLHAIRLAERLAEEVVREGGPIRLIPQLHIRRALAEASVHVEMAAEKAGIDLVEDHAVLDDRLRRAMKAIAESKGVEVEEDPYAAFDETEIQFSDGFKMRLKATDNDLRALMNKLREGERDERVSDELYGKLKRAQLALAEAKVSRQTEGVEAELLYLYRTDPAIRSRVRQMIDIRRESA